MQNPVLQTLNAAPVNNNLNQIKSMMNALRSANNPQALLQNMIQDNPQLKQVMDVVNQSNGDPKAAFYKLAEEKGIDPEQILSIVKSL